MRPRVGGGAVTTSSVSPASGSTSRCIAPALASGTVTLARAGSVMFRSTISGSGDAWPRSAKVSVHSAPLARPSLSSEGICGRLRRRRMAWPFSSGSRLTSPMMAPPLARIGSISIGLAWSNTSHTVSARRNSAAGVGAAKENVTRRPSLSRLASTVAALSLAPLSGGGPDAAGAGCFGGSAGGGACLGATAFGASAAVAWACSAGCTAFVASAGGDVFSATAAILSAAGATLSLAGVTFSTAGVAASATAGASVTWAGLSSILACSAIVSEVAGGISAGCCGGDSCRALSREIREAGPGLAGTACLASACGAVKAGFSACWKATSIT